MHFFVIRGFFVEGEGFRATQKGKFAKPLPHNLKTRPEIPAQPAKALGGKAVQKLLAQEEPDAGCSGSVRGILKRAHDIADALKHAEVDCEHLVLAMALDKDGRSTIEKFEFDPDRTRVAGVNAIASRDLHPEPVECKASRSQALLAIMASASERASQRETELRRCSIDDVLNSILTVSAAQQARRLIEGYDSSGPQNIVHDEVRALKSIVQAELRILADRVATTAETSQTILERINRSAPRRLWSVPPVFVGAGPSRVAANDNGLPLRIRYAAAGVALLLLGGVVGYLLHDGASALQRLVARVLDFAV